MSYNRAMANFVYISGSIHFAVEKPVVKKYIWAYFVSRN